MGKRADGGSCWKQRLRAEMRRSDRRCPPGTAACTFPEAAGRPLVWAGAELAPACPEPSTPGNRGRERALPAGLEGARLFLQKREGFWEEGGPAPSPPLSLCPQPPGQSNEAAPHLESKGLDWTPLGSKEIQPVILKEISPDIHWKDWCWSWNSNPVATWCEELTHWKRPWCWERLKVGGEGEDREWDGWMASPTQWTWVWTSSRS